ncbi:unnamed protein product, partial [marine sediment metagenome]
TEYTFTPTAGQCANNATLTITVNQPIDPTFDPVAAICSGDALTALPTTSNNKFSVRIISITSCYWNSTIICSTKFILDIS